MELSLYEKIKMRINGLAHLVRIGAYERIPHLGHSGFRRFVVISAPRSGSNMVVRLLQSHANLNCFGEVLGDRIYWSKRIGSQHPSLYSMRRQDSAAFLERYVWHSQPKKILAVGFKLLHSQAVLRSGDHAFDPGNPLLQYLLRMPELHVVVLTRRNALRRLLSMKKAQITGRDIALARDELEDDTPMILTTNECERFFRHHEMGSIFIREKFSVLRSIEIFYEDILSGRQMETNKVCDFLGVPRKQLIASTLRQSSMPLSKRILNFTEIKQHFTNTRWAGFFDEENEGELRD